MKKEETPPLEQSGFTALGLQRRNLLKYIGATAAVVTLASACKKDDPVPSTGINLGSGDVGILNYAYALEQLEAAFYIQVVATPYAGMPANELALLTEVRDHEIAHREFFKAALGTSAIPALQVNFTTINFNDRTSVLSTAKTFEDLGVSAYNGAGKLLVDANYLLLAGKIVSVEARHAAAIRDLISNGTFADSTVIDMNGLDKANTPATVLSAASSFLVSQLNGSNLPTS